MGTESPSTSGATVSSASDDLQVEVRRAGLVAEEPHRAIGSSVRVRRASIPLGRAVRRAAGERTANAREAQDREEPQKQLMSSVFG